MIDSTLRKLAVLLLILGITYSSCLGQQNNSSIERIGSIKNQVYYYEKDGSFVIKYKDISKVDKGSEKSFVISDAKKADKLFLTIIEGFNKQTESPIAFELENDQLRLYYKKRLFSDIVEIVHENKNTEVTGTLRWLNEKQVNDLFGRE